MTAAAAPLSAQSRFVQRVRRRYAGELALPNLMTPFLDRTECSRTVVLIDAVPVGAGQALRLLADDAELREYQALITERLALRSAPDGMSESQPVTGGMPVHLLHLLRL